VRPNLRRSDQGWREKTHPRAPIWHDERARPDWLLQHHTHRHRDIAKAIPLPDDVFQVMSGSVILSTSTRSSENPSAFDGGGIAQCRASDSPPNSAPQGLLTTSHDYDKPLIVLVLFQLLGTVRPIIS
jgi:hypothetical protein